MVIWKLADETNGSAVWYTKWFFCCFMYCNGVTVPFVTYGYFPYLSIYPFIWVSLSFCLSSLFLSLDLDFSFLIYFAVSLSLTDITNSWYVGLLRQVCCSPADEASDNFIDIRGVLSQNILSELGLGNSKSKPRYMHATLTKEKIWDHHQSVLTYFNTVLYKTLKLHKS